MTARVVDNNGFIEIKNNPISRSGIFEYYGSEIDAPNPNKLYRVLRSPEELEKATPLFNNKPVVTGHTMIGDGQTPPEKKGIDGIVNDTFYKDGSVYGTLTLYTDRIKKFIDSATRELSMGYWSEYEFIKGTWQGKPYDAIQRIIDGNHLAVLDGEGRMGKTVAVLDRKPRFNPLTITFDAKAIKMNDDDNNEVATEDEGDQETSETDAVYEDAEHEQDEMQTLQAILAKLDTLAPIAEKFAALEERVNKFLGDAPADPEPEASTDELPAEPDKAKEKMLDPKATEDRIAKRVQDEFTAKQKTVDFIRPLVGTADHSARSSGEVWKYAASKLDLKGDAETAVKAFAKAKSQQRASATQDSKPVSTVHKVNGKFQGDI
jgi:hypothetical protein